MGLQPLCIPADQLQWGDRLINIGLIASTPQSFGMFVVVAVRTSRPSLATGRIETLTEDHIFHLADELWVVRTGE